MRIMVTGGQSMIGRQVVELLAKKHIVDPVPHNECDLCDSLQVIERFESFKPSYVVHLAGYNGGIAWNEKFPERIFRKTMRMGFNVLETASLFDVQRVVSVISSCAYPDLDRPDLDEKSFWMGLPHPSVECHGLAKRFLHAFSKQLNKDASIKTRCICAVANNSYGPRDSFHPFKTKVVAALIRKFVEAKQENKPNVTCWGTGKPRREFTYCKDIARALVSILEVDKGLDLINIGSGQEYTIKELTEQIAELVGYEGEVLWDTSKPDGQMRKMLNSSLLREAFDFKPEYDLRTGLKETIEWYVANKEFADERCNL